MPMLKQPMTPNVTTGIQSKSLTERSSQSVSPRHKSTWYSKCIKWHTFHQYMAI